MTTLKDLLYKVRLKEVSGNMETEVKRITFDSRDVREGDLFVAIKGTRFDGHDHIDDAIDKGVAAVLVEKKLEEPARVSYALVEDTRESLGIVASNFYGDPSSKLNIVGVTGTNGKTSVATLLFQLFRSLGYSTGLISTVENRINEDVISATHTTPDAVSINALLYGMLEKGCTHCFMEVSSHAIDQRRIAGISFAGGIFTNITHDHLDYHKTFNEYLRAKKRFFDYLPKKAFALTNLDDKNGMVMLQNTKASKQTYSLKKPADFKGKVISATFQGMEMDIQGNPVWFRLVGDFNAYNLLAVYGAAILLNEPSESVLTSLSEVRPAPGRFEYFQGETGVVGIVDYAHTPDALENVITTINKLRTGNEKLITVFGCGGDRDKSKRQKMGMIAAKYSNRAVITSDNPRNEDPQSIIEEIQKGVRASDYKKTLQVPDRQEAIKTACLFAERGDIILVAGKGHEKYQEVKGVKYPFDDTEVLTKMLTLSQ